jgi:hypothetical protein
MFSEDSPDVVRNGFVNAAELDDVILLDLDARDHAEKECTLINASNFRAYFDFEARVWKIVLVQSGNNPEDTKYQTVYMNEKGKTLLIVYSQ